MKNNNCFLYFSLFLRMLIASLNCHNHFLARWGWKAVFAVSDQPTVRFWVRSCDWMRPVVVAADALPKVVDVEWTDSEETFSDFHALHTCIYLHAAEHILSGNTQYWYCLSITVLNSFGTCRDMSCRDSFCVVLYYWWICQPMSGAFKLTNSRLQDFAFQVLSGSFRFSFDARTSMFQTA